MSAALTREQRDKLRSFMSVTTAREDFALRVLERCRWDLEYAVNWYLMNESSFSSTAHRLDMKALDALYDKYKDPTDKGKIGPEGVMAFCADLGVDPTDLIVLILAYKFNASRMGEFTRSEFIEGMKALGVDSIAALKAKFPALLQEFKNPAAFKNLYAWTFDFAREQKKLLDISMAQNFWQLLLADKFPLLPLWNSFLVEHRKISMISRDAYLMLLEFAKFVNPDLSNYDESAAFPVLFDEFVEYVRERSKQ